MLRYFKGLSSRQADSTGTKNALRTGNVDNIISARRARESETFLPPAGRMAGRVRQRSQGGPVARDRLCRRACGAVDADPDQSEGGAGRSHGRRRGVRLGPEIPARLRQASAAVGLDRRRLVQGFSGGRLGDLCAGDGGRQLGAGDLLADRVARRRPSPRVPCRGDARALSDLQFQGFQVQSRSAAAPDAAAGRAGLSQRIREAQRDIRPLARPCRRAGADDQILGADHDRRHRACGADPSRALAVPAFAGAVGRDRNPAWWR